jgi:excisionase family DNA binding protein
MRWPRKMSANPFEILEAKFEHLATEVHRALRALPAEKADRKRRVGLPEAAQYVGLAERTLYKATHRRTIPHSKVGGRLYFDLDELDAWIDAGRRKTAAEVADERMAGKY